MFNSHSFSYTTLNFLTLPLTPYLVLLWPYPLLLQNDVDLIKEGTKVGASEATLLQMLKIMPFSYSLVVQQGECVGVGVGVRVSVRVCVGR